MRNGLGARWGAEGQDCETEAEAEGEGRIDVEVLLVVQGSEVDFGSGVRRQEQDQYGFEDGQVTDEGDDDGEHAT